MNKMFLLIFCYFSSFFVSAQNSRVFFDAGATFYQSDFNSFYQNNDSSPGLALGFGYHRHLKIGSKLALVGGIEARYGRITQQTQDFRNESGVPPLSRIETRKRFVTNNRVQTALVLGMACELGKWEIQLSALPTHVVHSKVRFVSLYQAHLSASEIRQEVNFIPRGEWFGEPEEAEENRIWYSSRFTLNGQASISRTIGQKFSLGLTYNQALTYQQLQFDPSNCLEQLASCSTTEPRKFIDPRLRRIALRFGYAF